MANDKKEGGASVKVKIFAGTVAALASTVGAIIIAQNPPWWWDKVFGGGSQPPKQDQSNVLPSPSLQSPSPTPSPTPTPSPSPTPSPTLTPSPTPTPSKNETIGSQTLSGVTLDLKSCAREERGSVRCTFVLSSNHDVSQLGLWANPQSKVVDSSGKEYFANRAQVGDKADQAIVYFSMTQGATYRCALTFPDIPISVSKVVLLSITVGGLETLKFRNIPIN